ncbi:MAG: hypothetical protein ACYCQJ_13135 [Nitrososphaerales archaeon]
MDRQLAAKDIKRTSDYNGNMNPVDLQCLKDPNHLTWSTTPAALLDKPSQKGTGCPHCSGCCTCPFCFDNSVNELDRQLAERKIRRTSDYKSSTEPVNLQCLKDPDHPPWSAIPGSLLDWPTQKGNGCIHCCGHCPCPMCYKKRVDELDRQLAAKDIKRTSDYNGNMNPVDLQCLRDPNHPAWSTMPAALLDRPSQKGTGCPHCSGCCTCPFCLKKRMDELDRQLAGKGIVRTSGYKGSHEPVDLQCLKDSNHLWQTTPGHLIDKPSREGSGCPYCLNLKNEKETREIIEDLIGEPFPKKRPKFLLYIHRRPLELDCFCKKHMLASEYNGEQHYSYIKHFHRNGEQALVDLQNRDRFKIEKCELHGIDLIIVPFTCKTREEKRSLIITELLKICEKRGVSGIGKFMITDYS